MAVDEALLMMCRLVPGRFPSHSEDSGSYCSETPGSPRGSNVSLSLYCPLDTERTCPIITSPSPSSMTGVNTGNKSLLQILQV